MKITTNKGMSSVLKVFPFKKTENILIERLKTSKISTKTISQKKYFVIQKAYTVVHKFAVMVKFDHTSITLHAVLSFFIRNRAQAKITKS